MRKISVVIANRHTKPKQPLQRHPYLYSERPAAPHNTTGLDHLITGTDLKTYCRFGYNSLNRNTNCLRWHWMSIATPYYYPASYNYDHRSVPAYSHPSDIFVKAHNHSTRRRHQNKLLRYCQNNNCRLPV